MAVTLRIGAGRAIGVQARFASVLCPEHRLGWIVIVVSLARSDPARLGRVSQQVAYLTVKAHAQVRVEVRVHEYRREQAREMIAVSVERPLVRFASWRAVQILVRRAEQLRDLTVKPHAQIRVEVRIHKNRGHKVHQLTVLVGKLVGFRVFVHLDDPTVRLRHRLTEVHL
jgi:hypothetical protein